MYTVKHIKGSQREVIIIEVTAWVIILSIIYTLAKVIL